MTEMSDFFERARIKHMQAEWYDPEHCERRDNSSLCHCHKRWREANGVTELPTEDLYFPPPDCPSCDRGLGHNGDGWQCDPCGLSWNSSGDGASADWTDVYGDDRPCAEHGKPFCWHCECEGCRS